MDNGKTPNMSNLTNEQRSLAAEAIFGIGWMYSQACSYADAGIDIRKTNVTWILDNARKDLGIASAQTIPITGLCSENEPAPPVEVVRPLSIQVIVKLQVEGTHNWPGCPIEEVDYLKHPHRHMFHIEARKKVTHEDRDVEIIRLGHEIRNYLHDVFYDSDKRCHAFGSRSCEMLATQLVRVFNLESCQVLEDGENGSIVTALDV